MFTSARSTSRAGRRLRRRLALIAGVAAVWFAVAASPAAAATSYQDSYGDSGTASDIGAVSITNTPDGQLTFTIALSRELADDDGLGLFFNSDRDFATGLTLAGGIDYALIVRHGTYVIGRWNGSTFVLAPSSTVRISAAAGGLSISVNSSDLGGTKSLGFWVRALHGDAPEEGNYDDAPSFGMWFYTLSVGQSGAYADPAGDSGTAPDIETVSVSNDATGRIAFQINVPGQPQLASDGWFALVLDTDQNPATGDPRGLGADYVLVLDGESRTFGLGRWNGSTFEDAPATTASVSYAGGLSITIDRTELGNTSGLNFWIRSGQGDNAEPGRIDDAPDFGTWSYRLASSGPGTLTPPAALKLSIPRLTALPTAPVAGSAFDVFAQVRRSDTGTELLEGAVSCSAKISGKSVRVAAAGLSRGTARCSFRIPAGTEGKRLQGSITVAYRNAVVSRTFSYTIVAKKRRTASLGSASVVQAIASGHARQASFATSLNRLSLLANRVVR
jgi:hypothetical protein